MYFLLSDLLCGDKDHKIKCWNRGNVIAIISLLLKFNSIQIHHCPVGKPEFYQYPPRYHPILRCIISDWTMFVVCTFIKISVWKLSVKSLSFDYKRHHHYYHRLPTAASSSSQKFVKCTWWSAQSFMTTTPPPLTNKDQTISQQIHQLTKIPHPVFCGLLGFKYLGGIAKSKFTSKCKRIF